jgi:hypothetical protein
MFYAPSSIQFTFDNSLVDSFKTWNKFCFTGGLIETSVVLPGSNNVVGLWPAIWAMGNLGKHLRRCIYSLKLMRFRAGRAGYGASLDGMVSPESFLHFPALSLTKRSVAIYLRFV